MFYNQALASGDYRSACRLLTAVGQVGVVRDGRELAGPARIPVPTTCRAALKIAVRLNPRFYRNLGRAKPVGVRSDPERPRQRVVRERFTDGRVQDVLAAPQRGRWLVVVDPYSIFA